MSKLEEPFRIPSAAEPESLGDIIAAMREKFESAEIIDAPTKGEVDSGECELAVRRFITRGIEPAVAELIASDEYERTLAVDQVIKWRDAQVRGGTLVLIGAPDQSKTFAASLAVALGAPMSPPSHYGYPRWESRHAPRLVRASRIRRIMLSRGYKADEAQDELMSVCVLGIDDLGTEYAADVDSSKAILHELVDTRRGRGLWTVITSNLDSDSFYRFVDERLLSRLKSKGSGLVNLHKKPQPKFRGRE